MKKLAKSVDNSRNDSEAGHIHVTTRRDMPKKREPLKAVPALEEDRDEHERQIEQGRAQVCDVLKHIELASIAI